MRESLPTSLKRLSATFAMMLIPSTAFAHTGHNMGSSFAAGFLHPLTGADHVLAMGRIMS
jgi:urease accessory protein